MPHKRIQLIHWKRGIILSALSSHPTMVGNFAKLDRSAMVQREGEIDYASLLNEIAGLGILLRSALLKPIEPRNCVGIVCKL